MFVVYFCVGLAYIAIRYLMFSAKKRGRVIDELIASRIEIQQAFNGSKLCSWIALTLAWTVIVAMWPYSLANLILRKVAGKSLF